MFGINKKLEKLGQSQLLNFYGKLSKEEQKVLIQDIKKTDIYNINKLYKNSYTDEEFDIRRVSPLKCIHDLSNGQMSQYTSIGKGYVKNNHYAIVIMAGGNGSRLGLTIPKGCLELNVNGRAISIFETYINQLKKVYDELGVYVNVFIMTSFLNHDMTVNYFARNNYFKYPKDKIHFFTQDKLPILDIDGKILLKNKYRILYGPNGNGNVFSALKKSGLLRHMKNTKVKHILFVTVDNVLSKLVDYPFIGCTINNKSKLTTKTLKKDNINSKDWVFCRYDNKPAMLPTAYQTDEIRNACDDDGNYLYNDRNITYHLIAIEEVSKYANVNLKYHRAYKMNRYMGMDGNEVIPNTPNTFKFEQFIFDAFSYSTDMLLYRVGKNEFCPIKTQEDIEYASIELSKKD